MAVEGPSNIHVAPSSAHIASLHGAAGKNGAARTETEGGEAPNISETIEKVGGTGAKTLSGIESLTKGLEEEATSLVGKEAPKLESKIVDQTRKAMIHWVEEKGSGAGAKAVMTRGAVTTAKTLGKAAPLMDSFMDGFEFGNVIANKETRNAADIITKGMSVGVGYGAAGLVTLLGLPEAAPFAKIGGSWVGNRLGQEVMLAKEAIENVATIVTSPGAPKATPVDVGVAAGIHDIAPKGTPANATTGSEGGAKG